MNFFSGPIVRALIAERDGPPITRGQGRIPEDATIEYFCRRVAYGIETAEDGKCWIYRSGKDNLCRGSITIHGKTSSIARLAYQLAKGPIPKGLYILHSCDVPACVNPSHLRAGTPSENMHDYHQRGSQSRLSMVYSQPHVAAKKLGIDAKQIHKLALQRQIPYARPTSCGRIWIPNAWIEQRLKKATVTP